MIRLDIGQWAFRFIPDELDPDGNIDLWAWYRQTRDRIVVLQADGQMCEVDRNDRLDGGDRKPLLSVPREALGSLMNSLWEMGVRPQGKRYEEETTLLREVMETQGKHLEDMQQLVFKERRQSPSKGGK